MASRPFEVTDDTQTLSVTTSSARVALAARTDAPDDARFYLLQTSEIITGDIFYVKFGDSTVVVTAGDGFVVHGGLDGLIVRAPKNATNVAAIGTNTGTLHVTPIILA